MGALLGVCVTLISAACADGLTGVDPMSIGAAPAQSASKAGSGGTVDVVCSTSYDTPGGPYAYGYGRLTVKLSAASRAADGSTRQYRYRGYAEGQRVVLAANCTIPNTERAFRQMNQRFGVKEAQAGRGWSDGGGATLMSDYTLPPLTVNACRYGGDYPECNPPPPTSGTETDNPPCWNDYGCDSGSGGSPSGGSDPEPEGEGDPEPCQKDPVIVATPVQQGFNTIWLNSNYSPTTPQADRREQGMFIIRGADGSLSTQPFPSSWTTGPCSISVPPNATPPAGAIAFVHTHPFTTGELMTICGPMIPGTQIYEPYSNQASFSDHAVAGILKLPGYMIDRQGISKFGANVSDGETRYERCGY